MLVLQNQGWMVVRFRRGPKASQEAAVSLVVAARAAHFGRQAGGSVGRMSCAIDGVAVAFADGAVASGKDVEPGDVLVDDYVVHMAATVAGMADETSEVAYLIARSIAHGGEKSARRGSCRFPIVAVRTVRAAEGQVSEVVRQNIHCGSLQIV